MLCEPCLQSVDHMQETIEGLRWLQSQPQYPIRLQAIAQSELFNLETHRLTFCMKGCGEYKYIEDSFVELGIYRN